MENKKIEINFPFILIRTKKGLSILEKISQIKFIKKIGWFLLYIFPIISAIGFYLILNSLWAFLSTAAIRDLARELTPLANILIPGINPYLPILYGWIALIFAIIIHEGAHGIVARSSGISIKSSGMVLLLILPIGAFVDVDEKELQKARAKDSGKVLAAGAGFNVIFASLALIGLIFLVGLMSPVVNGLGVVGIVENSQAKESGIMQSDVITAINGIQVQNVSEFNNNLKLFKAGETINIILDRNGKIINLPLKLLDGPLIVDFWYNSSAKIEGVEVGDVITALNGNRIESMNDLEQNLLSLNPGDIIILQIVRDSVDINFTIILDGDPENSSRPILGTNLQDYWNSHGIIVVGLSETLYRYKSLGITSPLVYLLPPTLSPYNIPFSENICNFYTSSLGIILCPLANLLFWIWFININLAIFNALPIYPLDGGQAFKIFVQKIGRNRINEKKVKIITSIVTISIIVILFLMIFLPYLI